MTNETIAPDDTIPKPKLRPWGSNISPGRLIISSFLLVIGLGAFLLHLPFTHTGNLSIIDALFASASSTCVTGLHVVPISSFTFSGHCIILGLVQIGGLGLMTLSFFLASIFLGKLGVATRALASQVLNFQTLGKIKNFLALIMTTTFAIELIGAIALYQPFKNIYPPGKAVFYAIFHSVTAFCNAGISPLDSNLIGMGNEKTLLAILGVLVFLGGLGFTVLYELIQKPIAPILGIPEALRPKRLSLHTRIVLYTSFILVISGTAIIWLLERNGTLADMTLWNSIENALLHSVWLRSAGFYTAKIATFAPATLFVFIILMIIGASPGSTGGGIKTTTIAIFLATLGSIMHRRNAVEIGGRTIPQDQLNKAIAIVALTVFWMGSSTFILMLTEQGHSFLDILFESASAFSTTGLSTGLTPQLSILGKLILITNMVVGRIGALTLIFALRKNREKHTYRFPEERVLMG